MSEYIDKGALLEALKNAHKRLIETIGYTRHTIGFEGAMDYVEEAPTADVVEVRHSVWRVVLADPDKEYECMNCKKAVGWKYLYCPNCGARMDGEEHDN